MPTASATPGAVTQAGVTARRVALVAAVAAVAGIFLSWYGNQHDFFDLRIYVSAMRWWADGHPLYDYAQPDRVQGELYFTYPPFTALLLRPFAELPVGLTIAIFTIGTVVATAVTTWWLTGPVADRHGWPRWYAAGLAIPLAFMVEPSRETITLGQINMLLIVLILADLLIFGPQLKGVGIGLATALKLFPGIFIVYLLLTRRWRAAAVASGTAAGATLLAAAIAPRDSWQFWTGALWDTDRVGRTDYTGNQSLLGLLSRLVAPDEPNRLIWLPVVALVAGYGLWRAAQASNKGSELTGLTITGLVGALISPITWPHHVYWFVPAMILLLEAELWHRVLAVAVFGCAVFGVVSFTDYGTAKLPTDTVGDFVIRNLFVLVSLVLVATLQYHNRSEVDRSGEPGTSHANVTN